MDRRSTPPNLVLIDKIVEYESGGMNNLKRSSRVERILRISAARLGRQNDKKRSTAFASSLEHVLNNLICFLSIAIRLKSIVIFFLYRTMLTLDIRRRGTHSAT